VIANLTGLKQSQFQRTLIDTRRCKRYIVVTFTAGAAGVSNEAQYVSCTGQKGRLEAAPSATGGMVSDNTNSAARIAIPSA
jgi:hypothetical protein